MYYCIENERCKLAGWALKPYSNAIRKQILSAKIKNDKNQLNKIIAAVLELWRPQYNFEYTVLPIPSSLRSKLLGRTDVAFHIAMELCARYGYRMKLPPLHAQFRFGKQTSFRNKWKGSISIQRNSVPPVLESAYLLVDDVVTTGQSLLVAAEQLNLSNASFLTYGFAGEFMNIIDSSF